MKLEASVAVPTFFVCLAMLLYPHRKEIFDEWEILSPRKKGREDDEGSIPQVSSQPRKPSQEARLVTPSDERKEMTPAARYTDQRWQIEHRIAELTGEQKLVGFEIQRLTGRAYEISQEIELLRHELLTYGEPS